MPDAAGKPRAFGLTQPGEVAEKPRGIPQALLAADEYVIEDDPQLQSIRRWIADNNAPAMQAITPVPVSAGKPSDESPAKPVFRVCPVYNESSSGYHLGWG